ncbi:hypothetical protein ONZ45_g12869 [Pleurotus djamor]|nr:hypothetical protein ONZ45_g12869 [Pleurotus djamor]
MARSRNAFAHTQHRKGSFSSDGAHSMDAEGEDDEGDYIQLSTYTSNPKPTGSALDQLAQYGSDSEDGLSSSTGPASPIFPPSSSPRVTRRLATSKPSEPLFLSSSSATPFRFESSESGISVRASSKRKPKYFDCVEVPPLPSNRGKYKSLMEHFDTSPVAQALLAGLRRSGRERQTKDAQTFDPEDEAIFNVAPPLDDPRDESFLPYRKKKVTQSSSPSKRTSHLKRSADHLSAPPARKRLKVNTSQGQPLVKSLGGSQEKSKTIRHAVYNEKTDVLRLYLQTFSRTSYIEHIANTRFVPSGEEKDPSTLVKKNGRDGIGDQIEKIAKGGVNPGRAWFGPYPPSAGERDSDGVVGLGLERSEGDGDPDISLGPSTWPFFDEAAVGGILDEDKDQSEGEDPIYMPLSCRNPKEPPLPSISAPVSSKGKEKASSTKTKVQTRLQTPPPTRRAPRPTFPSSPITVVDYDRPPTVLPSITVSKQSTSKVPSSQGSNTRGRNTQLPEIYSSASSSDFDNPFPTTSPASVRPGQQSLSRIDSSRPEASPLALPRVGTSTVPITPPPKSKSGEKVHPWFTKAKHPPLPTPAPTSSSSTIPSDSPEPALQSRLTKKASTQAASRPVVRPLAGDSVDKGGQSRTPSREACTTQASSSTAHTVKVTVNYGDRPIVGASTSLSAPARGRSPDVRLPLHVEHVSRTAPPAARDRVSSAPSTESQRTRPSKKRKSPTSVGGETDPGLSDRPARPPNASQSSHERQGRASQPKKHSPPPDGVSEEFGHGPDDTHAMITVRAGARPKASATSSQQSQPPRPPSSKAKASSRDEIIRSLPRIPKFSNAASSQACQPAPSQTFFLPSSREEIGRGRVGVSSPKRVPHSAPASRLEPRPPQTDFNELLPYAPPPRVASTPSAQHQYQPLQPSFEYGHGDSVRRAEAAPLDPRALEISNDLHSPANSRHRQGPVVLSQPKTSLPQEPVHHAPLTQQASPVPIETNSPVQIESPSLSISDIPSGLVDSLHLDPPGPAISLPFRPDYPSESDEILPEPVYPSLVNPTSDPSAPQISQRLHFEVDREDPASLPRSNPIQDRDDVDTFLYESLPDDSTDNLHEADHDSHPSAAESLHQVLNGTINPTMLRGVSSSHISSSTPSSPGPPTPRSESPDLPLASASRKLPQSCAPPSTVVWRVHPKDEEGRVLPFPEPKKRSFDWPSGDPNIFCHQCRNKTGLLATSCSCEKRYCIKCIMLRYDDQVYAFDASESNKPCPACMDICNCTSCCSRRKETYVSAKTFSVRIVGQSEVFSSAATSQPSGRTSKKPSTSGTTSTSKRPRVPSEKVRASLPEPRKPRPRPVVKEIWEPQSLPPVPSSGPLTFWGTIYGVSGQKVATGFMGGQALVVAQPLHPTTFTRRPDTPEVSRRSSSSSSSPDPVPNQHIFIGKVQRSWGLGPDPGIEDGSDSESDDWTPQVTVKRRKNSKNAPLPRVPVRTCRYIGKRPKFPAKPARLELPSPTRAVSYGYDDTRDSSPLSSVPSSYSNLSDHGDWVTWKKSGQLDETVGEAVEIEEGKLGLDADVDADADAELSGGLYGDGAGDEHEGDNGDGDGDGDGNDASAGQLRRVIPSFPDTISSSSRSMSISASEASFSLGDHDVAAVIALALTSTEVAN